MDPERIKYKQQIAVSGILRRMQDAIEKYRIVNDPEATLTIRLGPLTIKDDDRPFTTVPFELDEATASQLVLPAIPSFVKTLNIQGIGLPIPSLPSGLETLNIYGGEPRYPQRVPELPPALKTLSITNARLTELPTLPPGLTSLHCNNNQLTHLPALPETLQYLHCQVNNLSELPPLPASLVHLDCSVNNFIELPPLPTSLHHLDCHSNQIQVFQPFPETLESLRCYNNQLRSLPELPPNLMHLQAHTNKFPPMLDAIYTETDNQLFQVEMQGGVLPPNQLDALAREVIQNTNRKVELLSVIPNALQQRQQNLKRRAKTLLGVKTIQQGRPNLPSNFFGSEIGSQVSGLPATMSLNNQYRAIKQKMPQFQPFGITQQPVVPPHIQRKLNANTRVRLRRLLQEEKNMQNQTVKNGGKRSRKSKARKTRKH